MKKVLARLRDNQLYVKGEKCEFHVSVKFLGYMVSSEGVEMKETRVNAVRNWLKPNTIKKLQLFC